MCRGSKVLINDVFVPDIIYKDYSFTTQCGFLAMLLHLHQK